MTRDPRDRTERRPQTGREAVRDPTQPLTVDVEPDDPDSVVDHPSLAVGTSGDASREQTRIETPAARTKTIAPRPSTMPPPIPRDPDDPELRVGSVLGSYRLVELLGKGGMGYVYRAEHVKLGREVALKLLRADYARRHEAVLRFFQEAKTVNRVRHRNIVDVTDFIELDDGTTFIIMELLGGDSLGKWARTGVDLPRALAVLVQICDGLGAAHAVGVVHRDLKPDNVNVSPTPDGAEIVKLLDFGVAKLVNRDDEDVGFQTAAGSVIGTPAYMSPEQAGGMALDHRSDIYSLGAIMYELFCGQPMFRGRSFGEYVRKHLTEVPVPPRQTQGGATIDDRLERLILKCLAKDPHERFAHILELRDGLLYLLGGGEMSSPYVQSSVRLPTTQLPPHMLPLAPPMATTMPSAPAIQPGSAPYHYSQTQPPEAPTAWWMWLAGGAFAIALGIVTAVWYASRTSGDSATAPAATASPTAVAIDPTPFAAAQLVELRFDSLPSGGVYADGHSAELCRTPCRYNLDLHDGGALDRRTFVVRSDGYRDHPIEVVLTAAHHDYHVTLERLAAAPGVPAAAAATPDDSTDRAKQRKPFAPPTTPPTPAKTPERPATKTAGKATPPAPALMPDKPLTKPAPSSKQPDGNKIDRADTLDPFHRHP